MAIPEKYYNYLACIGLGVVLFVILDKILAVDHSSVKEPFKDSAKKFDRGRISKDAALDKLVNISKDLTTQLDIDVYGKKAPNTDQPAGGIYQQILEELDDEYISVANEEKRGIFQKGDGVSHIDYGLGVVTKCWEIQGQRMVRVNFQSGKIANWIEEYANLDFISGDE